jgi:hypothetical protein
MSQVRFENRYGLLDRALHRFAFASGLAQCGAADLEERLFRRELEAIELGSPVMITALPRAGTTILLELLAGTSTFASHTYRDMPFVLCPMLWHQMSKRFRRTDAHTDAPRERMHGDGIQISLDSPEALEEVVWMRFWPKKYRGRCIEPWHGCDDPAFAEFLSAHMRKIVALRARDKPTAHRYLSKNNLNIARIPAIWTALPSATLIVTFRDPMQHAASLLRQHRRFSEHHASDPFVRSYMAAIGHFDFGANLKPVDFDGWTTRRREQDPDRLDYWLDYWRATYRHILRHVHHGRLHLVGFEALCEARDLTPLAERLDLDPRELRAREGILRVPQAHDVAADSVSAEALEDANELYARLQEFQILG